MLFNAKGRPGRGAVFHTMIFLEYKDGTFKKEKQFDIKNPPKEVLKVHFVKKKKGGYKLRCSLIAIGS